MTAALDRVSLRVEEGQVIGVVCRSGPGKSMLAARLPSILPPPAPEEMLELSMVHSLAGELMGGRLATERPFRAPHDFASLATRQRARRNLALSYPGG